MAIGSYLHHLFNAATCQSYIHRLRLSIGCGGKIAYSSVRGVRATTSVPGARTTINPDSNATAVKSKSASAPSMISRARYWTAASAP